MNRRVFIKGALLTSALLVSEKAFADKYSNRGNEKLRSLKKRDKPSGLEKKHVPLIKTQSTVKSGSWFDVTVNVGFMAEHPSAPDHWITYVKLLVNGGEVAQTEYKVGGVSSSSAVFKVRLDRSSKLEAIENCNLHGTWISDPVEVTVV